MEHARAHGYPVPAARALNDTDIVMERADGTDDARRPDAAARGGCSVTPRRSRMLLDRLHAITAPDWLPSPLGEGDALLHLDLHPDNVILTRRGPVVIDWPNAARGPAAADVAHTWIVLACSLPTRGAATGGWSHWAGRRLFLALFLRHYSTAPSSRGHLPAVADWRAANRTLPPERSSNRDQADGGGARIATGPRRENAPSWPAGRFRVTEDLPGML